jgi:hypothetical protein
LETTGTTCKNNIFFLAAQLRGDLETGRGCARITKVVFISCHCCFLIQRNLSSFTFPCEARAAGYTAKTTCVLLTHYQVFFLTSR